MSSKRLFAMTRSIIRVLTVLSQKVRGLRESYHAFTEGPEIRGIALLKEWLSPAQLAQFDATRSFDVIGCQSLRRYRIRYGNAMNVIEIDGAGDPVMGWCFLPAGGLVPGDVMLAQKIALENHEFSALKVAHQFPVKRL